MSTEISITGLTKVFAAGSAKTIAVDRVKLTIEPGELFFLLGPSGCGKTTLLRMIAGFIEPTSGTISFNGRDITGLPPEKRNTGMVFQSYALWPHMTVEANVAFGLGIRKVGAEEKSARVAEALKAVHMDEFGPRKPNQLSGGQQQRVALARALVIRPEVLLLDEPLSNLDARLRIELRSEIRRICKDAGITTVYVTHDQKEALSMADRVAVLDAGRIIQTGSPRELYRRPRTKFVAEFLGETNFLKAKVISRENGTTTIDTPAGRLVSTHTIESENAICSIRPEALLASTNKSPNSLRGQILESTYLGELAQHTIEPKPGVRIRASFLNPPGAPPTGQMNLSVDPDDVVLVPAD